MARDYAKTPKTKVREPARRRPAPQRQGGSSRTASDATAPSVWRYYFGGLLSGLFLSFLLYLGALPATTDSAVPETAPVATVPAEPPKPRFDFYTMLPEQTLDEAVGPAELTNPPPGAVQESYVLQAGSFRQREDAERRRAELLLLGLTPNVEEADSDNGRWYRVYLGPFTSHPEMTRARSLTAAQDIDTLMLKRKAP